MGKFFSLPSNPNRSSENTQNGSHPSLDNDVPMGTHIPFHSWISHAESSRSSQSVPSSVQRSHRTGSERVAAKVWGNVLAKYTYNRGGGRELHIIYITWNAQILSVCFKECWHFHMQVKPSLWTRFDCYYHPGRFHKASFSSVLLNLMATTFLFLAH